MGAQARIENHEDRPAFTVAKLAARWACSPSMVRKLIDDGKLASFRIGTLVRVRASEVERYECQNTPSSGSAGDMPSSGPKTHPCPSAHQATEAEEPSTPQIGRARKPRLAEYGPGATIHHGPWEG